MATTNGNRKILDMKRWEFCTPAPTAKVAGAFVASSRHYRQQQLFVTSSSAAWLYNPSEDGWVALPSPALAGTFGAGAAGCAAGHSIGTTVGAQALTATGGTVSTIVTNQSLARDLRGYKVQILAGPNAGATLDIVSNTIGAAATIRVPAQGAAFTASTVYRLLTPTFYVVGAGTLAAGSFRKYCFATNTWTTLANTGLPASLGTDGKLISTPSWMDNDYLNFGSGTATAGTATTLTQTGKTWAVNQWANSQVRIVSGAGAGQIRTIASNTADTLTVSAWATNPDATSVYQIQGNDDFVYYLGNNAVIMYRYSISANTWTTLAPGVARAGAPGAGMSGHWVWGATESDWNAESTILNGRYIYSFRGAGGAAIDRYDIAANTWAAITYAPAAETFGAGSTYTLVDGDIFVCKDATGRWFRFKCATNEMDGWTTQLYPHGAALVGDTAFDATYFDGATKIHYVYSILNTSAIMLRQMVI